MRRRSIVAETLGWVALVGAACVKPPAASEPARPRPLPFDYRIPYVVKSPPPPRFSAPLAVTVEQLESEGDLPPEPWLRLSLGRGDLEMQRRLLAAVARAARGGRLPPLLAQYYGRLLGFEPTPPVCTFLAESLDGDHPAPVRQWLWTMLARCTERRWAPWFERAAAPDAAIIEWCASGPRRDRVSTTRLERAAVNLAGRGDWGAARLVGFALANLEGDAAWRTLASVQRRVPQPLRQALLVVGFYDRVEPQARHLFARACVALRGRWEPLCDEEARGRLPADLGEQVRRWDLPTPELVAARGFAAVVSACSTCVDEAEDEGAQVRCLERLAQLDWSRAVEVANGIRRGRLDYPYARELLTGLRRYAGPSELLARLRAPGLLGELVAPRAETSVSLRDFFLAHGRGLTFDTETDQFPNEHDDLAGRLAGLVRPTLDAVWFEELPPADDEAPYRLRAFVDQRLFEVEAQNYGDWYDLEAVLGLLNALLRRQHSEQRLITLASGDQTAMVVAGEAGALAALAAEGLLVTGAAQSGVEHGQESDRRVLEQLRGGGSSGIFEDEE